MNEKKRTMLNAVLLTLSASFIYAINAGIRNNYGLMLKPLMLHAGISFTSISFILAVGQLIFGVAQPFSGIIAVKKSSIFSLMAGVILTIAGIVVIPLCKSAFSMMIVLGFILPTGTGFLSYGIIIGTLSNRLPKNYISTVSGIVNASSGVGNILISPVIQSAMTAGGLIYGVIVLAIPSLLMIPLTIHMVGGLKGSAATKSKISSKPTLNIKSVFKTAFSDRRYTYLMISFFTCGFHMALITNHLPTQLNTYNITAESVAYSFSIYGITTILGSVISGALCTKIKMKNVLSILFALRPIIIISFLLVSKTNFTVYIFLAFLGFTGAPTVPPVSGIIGKIFGMSNLAILFGFVFFIHQVGSFFSSWLGGIFFNMTNSYVLIWIISAVLSIIAAIVSFIIKENNQYN